MLLLILNCATVCVQMDSVHDVSFHILWGSRVVCLVNDIHTLGTLVMHLMR